MAVIEAIQTTYLEAAWTASVTFDDIPSTYEHLQLRISMQDTTADVFESLYMQLGDSGHSPVDTGTNYARHYIYAYTNNEYAGGQSGSNDIWLGKVAATTAKFSALYGPLIVNIYDYANANKNTSVFALDSSGTGDYIRFTSGMWMDTSVVNAVLIKGNGNLGRSTEMTLYGLNSS